jgi:hypothetical protein
MAYHHFSSFSRIFCHFSAKETTPLPFGHVMPRGSLGPGRRSVAVPRTWKVLRTSRWPRAALCPQWLCQGLGRSPDRSWGSPDFDGKNNSPLYVRLFLNFYGVMMVMVMMMMMRNFFKINPLEVNIEQREGEVIGAEMVGLEVQSNQS